LHCRHCYRRPTFVSIIQIVAIALFAVVVVVVVVIMVVVVVVVAELSSEHGWRHVTNVTKKERKIGRK
jgi:hypothetical protein